MIVQPSLQVRAPKLGQHTSVIDPVVNDGPIMGEIASLLSHEVRVGLATMRVSLDLLHEQDVLESPRASSLLAHVERSCCWIESMIENADWVQRPSDLASLQLERITIRDVIDPIISLIGPLLKRKGQCVLYTSPKSTPFITGDATRLSQVVCNLLSNASTYGPAGEPICLDVTNSCSEITIRVTDRGPGLIPDELEAIFGCRVRGSAAVQSRSHGLGLGLYLAKSFVEAHGGRIGVESDAGHGASFWFTLPVRSGGQERM